MQQARDEKAGDRNQRPIEGQSGERRQNEGFGKGPRDGQNLREAETKRRAIIDRHDRDENDDDRNEAPGDIAAREDGERRGPGEYRQNRQSDRCRLGAERADEMIENEREQAEARLPVMDEHHVAADAVRIEIGQGTADIDIRIAQNAAETMGGGPKRRGNQ